MLSIIILNNIRMQILQIKINQMEWILNNQFFSLINIIFIKKEL